MNTSKYIALFFCLTLGCGSSPSSPENLAGFFDIETVTLRESGSVITVGSSALGGLTLTADSRYDISAEVSSEQFFFRDVGTYTTSGNSITFNSTTRGLLGTSAISDNGTKIKLDAELTNAFGNVIGTVEIVYVKQ